MTGVSVGASATYLDDVTLARAAARWGAFFASIDDDECQLLDRFALGDNLKSICFELGLSYDAIRKRLVRRQDALGLPSTATFLHFWMTVRGLGRTAADPTMLRYAELLRASLGYSPSMVLPSPETSAMALQLRSRAWRPAPSAAARDRADAEAMTISLLSPAAWHAVLLVATSGSWQADKWPHVNGQHELFQRLALVTSGAELSDKLVASLDRALDLGNVPWLRPMLAFGAVESPLLVSAPPLPWPRDRAKAPPVFSDGAFDSTRDFRFASELSVLLEQGNTAAVQRLLCAVDDSIDYGPLTGFSVALTFFQSNSPGLRAMISPLLNRLISCRAHLAETLGVHPTRLLDSIALTDCGVSAPAERYLLPGGDRLLALAAEQLLPEVRGLSTTGEGRPRLDPRR